MHSKVLKLNQDSEGTSEDVQDPLQMFSQNDHKLLCYLPYLNQLGCLNKKYLVSNNLFIISSTTKS